ncbi:DEAD-domain-containing protein, partial [Dacryopinax primogenitus]
QFISSLFTSNPSLSSPSLPLTQNNNDHNKSPTNAPLPSYSFSELGLHPLLVQHLPKLGITKPTSIQRASLYHLLTPSNPSTPPPDIFLQSQTGSGKTLAFLLPIIQDLLPLSSLSYIDRSIGTLAIILVPTRELARQISDVLASLLSLRLSPAAPAGESTSSTSGAGTGERLTRWLVPGLLTGGSTKTHEKARLRKGVPILVATPGRLLDHLQNTGSFSCGKLRWLVLDEADRLMDLGFEKTVEGIQRALEGRRKLAEAAAREGGEEGGVGWEWGRRRTVLCSATMREDVQRLAGVALERPVVVRSLGEDVGEGVGQELERQVELGKQREQGKEKTKFTPPAQLKQKYVVVPLKLRLVALLALLRTLLRTGGEVTSGGGAEQGGGGKRIIVFLSCTDAVDFMWELLGGTGMRRPGEDDDDEQDGQDDVKDGKGNDDDDDNSNSKSDKETKSKQEELAKHSPLLPHTSIYRLHGSLSLQTRLASLSAFSSSSSSSSHSILLSTSVASRGLDLPQIQAVVQYDLPTEGGATEYVHRVGRTARLGRKGEAWAFVEPGEGGWVDWVEKGMNREQGEGEAASKVKGKKGGMLLPVGVEDVLLQGFGGRGSEWEDRATQVQLAFERWTVGSKENAALARRAYASHIRAYATHPSEEKHIFHVRNLHLGHLAKSFALREAP